MIPKARRDQILSKLRYKPRRGLSALLSAALTDDDERFAREWATWRRIGPDWSDPRTRRLATAALPRLARAVPGDADLERIRGLHRRALYWYQLMAHRAVEVLDALTARGIPVLLLKGAALIARYRLDPGSRPMGDIDLAVPYARALEALAAIDALAAWQPSEPGTHREIIAHLHARDFRHRDGFGLDLHWNVLFEAAYPDADEPFWHAAVPARWQKREVQVLAPTDQLFHCLVQDVAQDRSPSPHGLLDAALVLAHDAAAIDWQRLVALAERFHQVLPLEAALHTLASLGQSVPAQVQDELNRLPVSRVDAWYYELRQLPRGTPCKPLRVISNYWFRRGRGRGPIGALRELPAYLRGLRRAP